MLQGLSLAGYNVFCIRYDLAWIEKAESMIVLIRVDPEKRMDRWYSVGVQPALFESYAVICLWENRRTCYQRERVIPADTLQDALALAEKIIQRRIRSAGTIHNLLEKRQSRILFATFKIPFP